MVWMRRPVSAITPQVLAPLCARGVPIALPPALLFLRFILNVLGFLCMSITYRVIIEPDKKGFHGYVPALKGCHTWGKTIQEAKKHLQQAILLCLESIISHGETIPHEVSFESFETVELPVEPRRRQAQKTYA